MKKMLFIGVSGLIAAGFANAYNEPDLTNFEQTHVCKSCDLTSVNLFKLNDKFKSFNNAILSGSDLSHADFTGKSYTWRAVNFDNAILVGASFSNGGYISDPAWIDFSSFVNADLRGVYLVGAAGMNINFTNANLSLSHLEKTIFSQADFTGANLAGADISDANFCQAKITAEQIFSAANYNCAWKPDCSGQYHQPGGVKCH